MALDRCVDQIVKRDYYEKLRQENAAKVERRIASIPYGYH